jgi:WD40 repeat protein
MTPDRKLLALLGMHFDEQKKANSYQLKVVDPVTWQEKLNVTQTRDLGEKLAITPDGTTVVVAEARKLHFWDVASGTEILEHEIKGRGGINSLAFSPDSSTLAIGSRNALQLWDWTLQDDPREVNLQDTGRMRRVPLSLEFAPDGQSLAVGLDGHGGVLLIDVGSGVVTGKLALDQPRSWGYVRDVVFSPDGSRLAATRDRNNGGGVLIWNPATRKHVCTLETAYHGATNLTFSPDGKMLAGINSWNDTLEVWDLRTNTKIHRDRPAHDAGPSCIRFLGKGQTVATASDDGTMRFWETRSGRQTKVLSHPKDEDRNRTPWIRAFAASPDGTMVASSSLDDTVRLWDVATGKQIYRLPGHGRLGGQRELAFTPDGKRFVSWGDDMRVYVWDVATGKALREYRLQPSGVELPDEHDMFRGGPGGEFGVNESAFSPDGSLFVLNLGKLYVFEVDSGKQLCEFEIDRGHPVGLAVSPDKEHLLLSQWGRPTETKLADGRVRFSAAKNHLVTLRRVKDGSVVKKLVLPEGGAGPVAFSPDGKYFATGARTVYRTRGQGGPIRVFLTDSGEEVGRIPGLDTDPKSLAFSADNRLLASGMRNTTVLVWDLAAILGNTVPSTD